LTTRIGFPYSFEHAVIVVVGRRAVIDSALVVDVVRARGDRMIQ